MSAKRLKLKPVTKFGPGGDTEEDIQAAAFKQVRIPGTQNCILTQWTATLQQI